MRIVTKIEVVDFNEDDYYRMYKYSPTPVFPISSDGAHIPPVSIDTITIKGRRFVRDGRTTVIGWAPGVEDLLNLPLECFENVQRDIRRANKEGYIKGKNAIWDFLKLNSPHTDYWWMPIPIFIVIGLILM